MDLPTVMRLARQTTGVSQRRLAELAGVSPTLIAKAESGACGLSTAALDRLLEVCDLDLELVARGPAVPDAAEVEALSAHLMLSTTQRLFTALGGTGHWSTGEPPPVFATLASARSGSRALTPAAALGLWLPERQYTGTLVDATVAREPSHHVRVHVGVWTSVWAAPPLLLALSHTGDDARLLRSAAAMLALTSARDEGGRRPPPHRTADEATEAVHMGRSLTYSMLPSSSLPDARDSRGWRLQQPVSLRQLLVSQGLPPRRGSSRG